MERVNAFARAGFVENSPWVAPAQIKKPGHTARAFATISDDRHGFVAGAFVVESPAASFFSVLLPSLTVSSFFSETCLKIG